MDWLSDHEWVAWVATALLLGGIELTTLDLTLLMLAAGALAAGGAAAVGAPLLLQVVVAAVVSVAMLGVVRPVALRHLRTPLESRTGVAALVGRQAVVLEPVDAHGGLVKLAGETWSARSYDPDAVLAPGSTVDVVSIEGATAVVLGTEI